jgi:hypothetical protein
MDGNEFEERLILWLGMPGEGEPYPHHTGPYPEDPRDARFDALCARFRGNDVGGSESPAARPRSRSNRLGMRLRETFKARR